MTISKNTTDDASVPRPWSVWRAEFEARGIIRAMTPKSRKERATVWSPLISYEQLDQYHFYAEWSTELDMPIARCVQVPIVIWAHKSSPDQAIVGLYQYMVAIIVGLGADLALVPGVREHSEAAETQWHDAQYQAREEFLATLTANPDDTPDLDSDGPAG